MPKPIVQVWIQVDTATGCRMRLFAAETPHRSRKPLSTTLVRLVWQLSSKPLCMDAMERGMPAACDIITSHTWPACGQQCKTPSKFAHKVKGTATGPDAIEVPVSARHRLAQHLLESQDAHDICVSRQ